jgi:hypothetical protein
MLDGHNIRRKPVGGKRPGAGRPPGSPNRITRPVKELAADFSASSIARLVELRDHAESACVPLSPSSTERTDGHARKLT